MINFNPNTNGISPNNQLPLSEGQGSVEARSGFSDAAKALDKYVSKVDKMQETADTSIQDLLTGKNNDLTAVVSDVAKADVSFKVLVGVRNKLIEAYKRTMNMQL